MHGVVRPLTNAILGDVRPAVIAFAASAGLLLLITCINVASLLVVRGLARVREIAVRSALGAGRARIVGQLVTESAILAAGGGILGTVLAAVAIRGFVALAPAGTPRLDEIQLNGTAIGGAVAITGLVTLLFALAPALATSRVELHDALRSGSRQTGAGRRFRLGTEALVVGQIALALLVLSAAGLITRSFMKLERVELAFDPSRLLIAELGLPYQGFGDTQKQLALLDRLRAAPRGDPGRARGLPRAHGPIRQLGGNFRPARGRGANRRGGRQEPVADVRSGDAEVLHDLRHSRSQGRGFGDQDRAGSPHVAIISASAARHYWPGADPIGKRLIGPDESPVTIVGVVPETRYRDLRDARPSIYFPLSQSSFPVAPMTLAIRAEGRPTDLVPTIRRAIGELEPGVALASAEPFETLLQEPLAQPRLNALLLVVFAGAAVTLAAVGLFGVMATIVRQRTRELGVRMALGASAADVGRLVLGRGMALAIAGTSVGMLGALVGNRLLSSMLFEVSPTDAPTLGVVASILLCVAALASLIPTRASTRIDPVVALRAE